MALTNWPIGAAQIRVALGYSETQGDTARLDELGALASSHIDQYTGRNLDDELFVIEDAVLPMLVKAAVETARLWWSQETPTSPKGESANVPMGAALPSKVANWLNRLNSIGWQKPPGEDGEEGTYVVNFA